MAIHIFKTVDALIIKLAEDIVASAQQAIASREEFNIVLSGGSSPEASYKILASPTYTNQVDWNKINFFFGDERNAPAEDPQNNAHMVREALFHPRNISAARIFAVDTSLPPEQAAKDYTKRISEHFKGKEIVFDLILLGLGDDAHTASLFPHTTVLADTSVSIQSVFVEKHNTFRITMTAPMINQARDITFLVYGQGKAEAVHHVLEDEVNTEKYPAQLIQPVNGNLQWYVDEAAASQLRK